MNRNKLVLATLMFTGLATCTVFAQSGGADVYKSKCAMCHGADGTASSPAGKAMKTPSFKDPAVMKMSSAELAGIVKAGKGRMPAYGSQLSDAQIKSVVAYIHTLQK
ncbi:MAG: cytochrome c [Terriglobia bacterium]|nr:cytochrome c [Terriglobia bacterium]